MKFLFLLAAALALANIPILDAQFSVCSGNEGQFEITCCGEGTSWDAGYCNSGDFTSLCQLPVAVCPQEQLRARIQAERVYENGVASGINTYRQSNKDYSRRTKAVRPPLERVANLSRLARGHACWAAEDLGTMYQYQEQRFQLIYNNALDFNLIPFFDNIPCPLVADIAEFGAIRPDPDTFLRYFESQKKSMLNGNFNTMGVGAYILEDSDDYLFHVIFLLVVDDSTFGDCSARAR
ncbi:hypothetical protein QOT17_012149 [Balamuthia mandrillaris]